MPPPKAAISNFTAALAQLLADRGIRVNAVAPGPIWTPLIPSTMPAEKAASFGQQAPLSRAGQPKELAPAFVLLGVGRGKLHVGGGGASDGRATYVVEIRGQFCLPLSGVSVIDGLRESKADREAVSASAGRLLDMVL